MNNLVKFIYVNMLMKPQMMYLNPIIFAKSYLNELIDECDYDR
jgi:hypothetical protein